MLTDKELLTLRLLGDNARPFKEIISEYGAYQAEHCPGEFFYEFEGYYEEFDGDNIYIDFDMDNDKQQARRKAKLNE